MERGPLAQVVQGPLVRVTSDSFEERMSGRNPLQFFTLGGIAIRRTPGVAVAKRGKLPVRVPFEAAQNRRRANGHKGMWHTVHWFKDPRYKLGGLVQKPRD